MQICVADTNTFDGGHERQLLLSGPLHVKQLGSHASLFCKISN